MSDDAIPTIKPWQLWLAAIAVLALGAAMLAIGVWELTTLIRDLRTLPPVVVVTTDIAGFLPLGVAALALGLFFAFPPATANIAGRPRVAKLPQAGLNRSKLLIVTLLVCLLLYPVLAVTLRVVTDNMLSARGYTQAIVDPGFRSSYLTIRWTRGGAR